jgi:hypothetical protein
MSCICVVGMHRSGTSCLTGIMQGLGVELGEVYTENLHNRRGNRENGRIVTLNDAVLNLNGGAWNNPLIVTRWTREQAIERDAVIRELSNRDAPYWGFKDPRTLFTLPFWLDGMPAPQFIGTFRHPQRVALSLQKRDSSTLQSGWSLWARYNERLLELAEQQPFPITDFDQSDAPYLDDVLSKLMSLGLNEQLAEQGRDFFDPALRNQTGSDVSAVELPSPIAALHSRLRAYTAA